MKKTALLLFLVVLLVLVSCASTGKSDNPYDVGLTMAERFLSTPVLSDFQSKNGRVPVVVVGLVSSSDADDTQVSRGFQNKLVASGLVDLIISSSERDSLREERIEQLNWGNMDQAKSLANEMVADYFGRIFITPYGQNYLIAADIVEVETGKIVWSDQYNKAISLPEKSPSQIASQTARASAAQTAQPAETKQETKPVETKPVVVSEVQEPEYVLAVGEKDELGRYVVANLANNVTLLRTPRGNMIFQFRLKNTDMNYLESGYPDSSWPTYRNTFNIDLNDYEWAAFKGKKIRLSQEIKYYLPEGGSSTSGSLTTQPAGDVQGLYDLKGKSSFSIISEVKTPAVTADDLRYEIGVLLPLELKDGGPAVRITEFPSVVLFDADFSPEKAYIISLRDIPETPYGNGLFSNLITRFVGGDLIYVESRSGERKDTKGYVMNVSKHGNKYDADLYITGFEEDFILYFNELDYNISLYGDYGTISFKETKDTSWPKNNAIDLSTAKGGSVTVKSDEAWGIVWALPENDDNSYRLTLSSDGVSLLQTWSRYGSGGGASQPVNENFIISNTDNTNGFIAVYSTSPTSKLTWNIEKL